MERLKACLAGNLIVLMACTVYLLNPYNEGWLARLYVIDGFGFTGRQFLAYTAAGYGLLLTTYVALVDASGPSKSVLFFRALARLVRAPVRIIRQGLPRDERVAVLATLLKMFFAPLMVMQLLIFTIGAIENGHALLSVGVVGQNLRTIFDRYGFWLTMQVILFIDVLIFTIGYLVESPRLGNTIRSVDPTLLGWIVVLLCYPPFNLFTGWIFGSATTEFPQFDDTGTHIVLNVVLLALMAIYASASVALGWKASNLTHRGIINRGPYAYVRHPAYTCKNIAWWIGAIPLVAEAFRGSVTAGLLALSSVVATTMLYTLRALTEEDHLRSVDDEYAAYAQRVRYRFIPGVV